MNETKPERVLQIVANLANIMAALRGVTYLMIIIGLPIAVAKTLPLIERAVVVLEGLDSKVDRVFEAAAPVGREAVIRAIDTLKATDPKSIGKELTEAIKRKLKGEKRND